MHVIGPHNHKEANKIWIKLLGGKPNGARTLGGAMVKHIAPFFEPYYDLFVAYASDIPFEIPKGTKRIAVMWHQNFPWVNGITIWRKVNSRLSDFEVDYFCNEPHIIELIEEQGGNAYYLPRFIDTTTLPKPQEKKEIPTLWYGNRWAEFANEFANYKASTPSPFWISQGTFGKGDDKLYSLNRADSLQILNEAKTVWAIGVSQLEAQYFGAEIVSYRNGVLPYYDQHSIVPYTIQLLNRVQYMRDQKASMS